MDTLPLISMRPPVVLFPDLLPLAFSKERSIGAVELAYRRSGPSLVLAFKREDGPVRTIDDVYPFGVIGGIGDITGVDADGVRLLFVGHGPCRLHHIDPSGPCDQVQAEVLSNASARAQPEEVDELIRVATGLLDDPFVRSRLEEVRGQPNQLVYRIGSMVLAGRIPPAQARALLASPPERLVLDALDALRGLHGLPG